MGVRIGKPGAWRFAGVAMALCLVAAPAMAEMASARARMIAVIETYAAMTELGGGQRDIDPAVIAAMGRAPRHAFVPEDERAYAYDDRPLPIGYGQTISQPYIVALMSTLLALAPGERVLEVGTGSGYQAAVLAEMGIEVYTIEIVPELAQRAAAALVAQGYDGVVARHGDGYYGWPDQAPFDAIVVTAASSHVPPPLIEQLAPGGRMAIPVGPPFLTQYLMLVEKDAHGEVTTQVVLPVRFVPLTGGG